MEPEDRSSSGPGNLASLSSDDLVLLLDLSEQPVVVYDAEVRLVYLNIAAQQQIGRSAAEVIGKELWAEFPQGTESFREAFERALRDNTTVTFELNYAPLENMIEGRCVPVELGGANGARALAVFYRDITQERSAHIALQSSEERLRLAVEGAQIGTWHWHIPSGNLYWSEMTSSLLGLPGTDAPTYDMFMDVIHPDDREATHKSVESAVANKLPYNVEYRAVWPDGSTHWHISRGRCYYNDDGTPIRMEGILIDITERKNAEEELRAQAHRQALVNRIEMALRTTVDPNEIQFIAVRELAASLEVDRCYFSQYDPAVDVGWIGDDFHVEGLPSLAGQFRVSQFQVSPEDFYSEGKTLVIDDLAEWNFPEPLVKALEQMRIRSGLAVPFHTNGRLSASLTVAMADTPRHWTDDDIALVEAVAAQTRSAVEAARVAEREHRIATELQNALQPAAPDVPGLRIATIIKPAFDGYAIGGDFYDVFSLDKGVYALVVGDVSGKGLAAAAQVATVRNMLRAFLYQYKNAGESVANLNETLTAHNLVAGFVTAVVCIYDVGSSEIRYVSCGHEPSLISRPSSCAVEQFCSSGPPLGASEFSQYEEHSIHLGSNDVIILYTDGVSEAGPTRLDLFGLDRLTEHVAALDPAATVQEAAESIVAGASNHARGALHDDVCVLVAQRY